MPVVAPPVHAPLDVADPVLLLVPEPVVLDIKDNVRVVQLGPLRRAEDDVPYENIGGRLLERVDPVLRCCSLYWVEGAGVIRLPSGRVLLPVDL